MKIKEYPFDPGTRKVTVDTVRAFLAGTRKRSGNTRTDGSNLYLHGSVIAFKTRDRNNNPVIKITLAGWATATTVNRLNGVLRMSGAPFEITREDGQPWLRNIYTTVVIPMQKDEWYEFYPEEEAE